MSETEIDDMNAQMQGNTANVLIADSDPELPQFMLKILARKGILDKSSTIKKVRTILSAGATVTSYSPAIKSARSLNCPVDSRTVLSCLKKSNRIGRSCL